MNGLSIDQELSTADASSRDAARDSRRGDDTVVLSAEVGNAGDQLGI